MSKEATAKVLGLADDMQAEYAAAHVNTETGEILDRPTEAAVRASIQRVIDHAESIWDEWAWQVENQTWAVLGYADWDEMRRGEYGSLTSITAPRAERPELVSRFRKPGPDGKPLLSQAETASTLGVSVGTVSNYDPTDNAGIGRPRVFKTENSPAPKPVRRATDNAEVTLVNDLRGPWHHGLIGAAQAMTPEGRAHVIAALEATITRLKEI